jgi:hypothetical protein
VLYELRERLDARLVLLRIGKEARRFLSIFSHAAPTLIFMLRRALSTNS